MKAMKTITFLYLLLFILSGPGLQAQDDLMDLFGDEPETIEYAYATFKTTKVINAHSIENPAPGVLLFLIQHRFGRVNTGVYEFFGLDQATIRLGFEYGVNERLSLGVGRSAFAKTFDGFLKYKILRQSSGTITMPLSLSYYGTTSVTSLKWADMGLESRKNYFSSRMTFVHQLLVARKISSALSLQLMPTLVHKNLVKTMDDKNDIFSLGIGGRIKLDNRTSFNAEYFYTPESQISSPFDNPLSFGFDIETGGHVFQLHFSNARAFFDSGYLTETSGKWSKGDIYFGFNISRVFTIRKPETFKK
jgi:hypothetical protein